MFSFFRDRLREPSTFSGIALLGLVLVNTIAPGAIAIVQGVTAAAAALSVVISEKSVAMATDEPEEVGGDYVE